MKIQIFQKFYFKKIIALSILAVILFLGASSTALAEGGYTWTTRTNSAQLGWVGITESSDATKLAAIENDTGYVWLSTNSGSTWATTTSPGPSVWGAISSSADGSKIAVGELPGSIYISTNSGSTWTASTTSLGSRQWKSIAMSSDGTKIAAIGTNHVYISTNTGATWATSTTALGGKNYVAVAMSQDGTKLATVVHSGFIYTSTDSGSTWATSTSAGSNVWDGVAISSDGLKLYAVAGDGLGVRVSTNGGSTWSISSVGTSIGEHIVASPDGSKVLVVPFGSTDYPYISTDSGATWTAQNSLGTSTDWSAVAVASSTLGFAVTPSGDYIRTGLGDFTPPVFLSHSSVVIQTNATITWTTDEVSTSTVNYGLTSAYGTASSSQVASTSHIILLSGLTASSTYHYQLVSTDLTGNLATSSDYTFVTPPDTTAPSITSVFSGSPSTTGTTITWSTDENSDSQIEYGVSSMYTSSTTLDTSLVTSHSVSLANLSSNTTYHYRVLSKDASLNLATSTDNTFTTATVVVQSGGGGSTGGGSSGGGGGVTIIYNNQACTEGQIFNTQTGARCTTFTQDCKVGDIFSTQTGLRCMANTSTSTSMFTMDISLGMKSADVMKLQRYLNIHKFNVALTGPGSNGNETNYFGPATKLALIKFQKANNISPASGYFGPITRKYINNN